MSLSDSQETAPTISSVKELVERWPSLSEFADDLGVPYDTAKGMRRRGAIDSSYWTRVVASASRRGLAGVTYERLAILHEKPLST